MVTRRRLARCRSAAQLGGEVEPESVMKISKSISGAIVIWLAVAALFLVGWYAGYSVGYAADARYWNEHPRPLQNCGWKL